MADGALAACRGKEGLCSESTNTVTEPVLRGQKMCSDIGSRQRCGAEMQNGEEKPCGDGQSAGSILTEQYLLPLVSDDWSPRGV